MPEKVAAEILACADVFDRLVTHTPPFGCAYVQHGGSHEGGIVIADALLARALKPHLCGHIHFRGASKAFPARFSLKSRPNRQLVR